MPSELAPLVDVRDMVRLVGQSAFQRGREYARDGAVSEIDWDDESGLLSSTVRGSAENPYRCHIELAPARDGYHRPVSGNCSCPLMANCKHVAATLVECNTIHLREPARSSTKASEGLQRGSDLAKTNTQTRDAAAPPPPDWKTVLGALTEPPVATVLEALKSDVETPLALQFELREQTPRTRDRWRGPTATAATSWQDGVEYRLGVRPAVLSGAGNWVRGNVTWNSLGYQSNRLALNPVHQRWFAQFAALYRATTRDVYTGQDTDWIYLDEFHSTLLWQLLDEARRLGVELIGAKKDAVVTVGSAATVSLDAARDAASGDLSLAPVLVIDGQPLSASSAGAIGGHGVYSAGFAPTTFTLAPTAAPLTDEQRRLLGREATVAIPAADVDEFLGEYFATLRRGVSITSLDASVDLPQVLPPILVLSAKFGRNQSLALAWEWEYQAGPKVRRIPLGPSRDDSRDLAVESAILGRVEALLAAPPATVLLAPQKLQGLEAAEFCADVLPLLEAVEGLRVDTTGKRPDYRELTEVPTLVVTTVETDKRDWFDLGVIVTIEGRKVPFGPLFAALSKGLKKLMLVDNSYLSLEQPVFDELRVLLAEASALAEWEPDAPKISRYQASLWADFEDLADETEQAVSWRATAAGLMAVDGVEATPPPAGLHATLRPYQQDGFDWLAFLWTHGLGGVLADDMGLGKTLQTLALVQHARSVAEPAEAPGRQAQMPFLVVAPTSVVSNWVTEAQRFTPGLVVRGITATNSKSRVSLAAQAAGADIVVTSYALFRLDFDRYQELGWAGLVLDEAQFVKNPASKAHQAAVDLAAPFKLAITGTPMENSLVDLWSLFQIVAPGLFPSHRRFTDDYIKPITSSAANESERAAELLAQLRRRIRPLMMRRTKDLVATELPAKQEQVLTIDLAPRHRALYDTFLQKERQKLLGLIDDMDKNRFIVFRSLTLLRMLSLDASLVDDMYSDIPSSKLDALFEQLDDVVAEGHRALVFSQFTSFLKKTAARLDAQGIAYEYLDGATLKRADVIARFKQGDAPLFLISLKAGGFGLNLTEADYVFMLDPWWNPASEAQAIDRTHRIGQTKNVMVYRMVARGTIEEKVMALKEQKSRLFDAVMDDDAVFSSALTADDIRGLLES
ncbi:superfamily II DNA or RNA helicase [Conyzicola lurida]|uniref:Superfamily II DNA or RNA helicase n=1 Tax=Conyzicola lurida TaxID=1172621 RepID=A0A841AM86_9MICO|nr:DEAD/DEAH box helicase [Conyzicola lurida]MBB5843072.1 superfamily II DNA or RNA helicase [Conyzicola lurida]